MRLKTHKNNSSIMVVLDKPFCKKHNITGDEGEYVDLIVHRIIKQFDEEEQIKDISRLIKLGQ